MSKAEGNQKINFTPADMNAMSRLLEVFSKVGDNDDAVYRAIINADETTIQGVFIGWGKTGASVEGIKNYARLMLEEFK